MEIDRQLSTVRHHLEHHRIESVSFQTGGMNLPCRPKASQENLAHLRTAAVAGAKKEHLHFATKETPRIPGILGLSMPTMKSS